MLALMKNMEEGKKERFSPTTFQPAFTRENSNTGQT